MNLNVEMVFVTSFILFSYFGIGLSLIQSKHEVETLAIENIRVVLGNKGSNLHNRVGNNLQERVLWEAYRIASTGVGSAYDSYIQLDQLLDNSTEEEDPAMTPNGQRNTYNTFGNLDTLRDSSSKEGVPDMAFVGKNNTHNTYV